MQQYNIAGGAGMRFLLLLGGLLTLVGPVGALEIAVSTPALASVVREVVAPNDHVSVLLPPGSGGHHASMRPSGLEDLRRADLVVWLGGAAEPALARPVAGMRRQIRVLDLPGLDVLELRAIDGRPVNGSVDPHVWLSLGRMRGLAGVLADELSRMVPGSAAVYGENRNRFDRAASEVSLRLRARFSSLPDRRYAAWHDAYQYLDEEWGLSRDAVFVSEPEASPGARMLLQLAQRWESHPPSCLLTESGMSVKLPKRLLPQARVGRIDETLASYGMTYLTGMERLAADVLACLGGRP